MKTSCRYITGTLLLMMLATAVHAGEPLDQLRRTTEKILAIVQDPDLKGASNDGERQKQMKKVVDDRFDWASMARSAMGRNWHDLTEAQRGEFTGLFGELIEKTYMAKVES